MKQTHPTFILAAATIAVGALVTLTAPAALAEPDGKPIHDTKKASIQNTR
jgi:hypothetical protein